MTKQYHLVVIRQSGSQVQSSLTALTHLTSSGSPTEKQRYVQMKNTIGGILNVL